MKRSAEDCVHYCAGYCYQAGPHHTPLLKCPGRCRFYERKK